MKLAVVFDPDPDLGPDPLDDTAKTTRRLGEFLDSDKLDILLVYREVGSQFTDGERTHVIGSGIWENLTTDQVEDALAPLFESGL